MFDLQVKCRNGERYLLKYGFGTSTPASGGPSAAEAYRLLQLFDEHAQKQIYGHFFGVGRPIDPFVEQKEHPTGNGVSRPPLSPIAKNEDISLYAARYQFDSYSIDKPLYLAFISKRIVVNSAPLTNYENEALSGSLKVQIRQALYEIVNIERIEKAQIQANYQKLSTWKKFTAHTSATGEGLADAAWGLAVWAKDVGEVVVYANPVRKAYITTRNAIEAGGFSEEVLEQSHNEFVSGAKKELVDVLGFDPSTVTVEQLYAALGLAELIYADEPLFTLFTQFAKDYAKAQHSTEVAKIAGGGVFEIILTVVLAAVTGGAAVLAVVASKARLMKYFTKVGDLVMEYAKVLKRRKQILEESASKSKPADFSDFATSDYVVPKEKAKESYKPNPKLTVGRVDYGSTDLSRAAIEYAKSENIQGARNIAVFEYLDANGNVKIVARASQRGKGHAEKLIAEQLKEMEIPNDNVLRIYSELEPCSAPGGYCKSMIEKGSKKNNLGPFNNAKVTYSIEYGGEPHNPERAAEGVSELKKLRANHRDKGK